MEKTLYFDNAATTFPKPEEVYQALDMANRELAVNAGRGSYALARRASQIILDTREALRKLTNASEVAEVVITASATLACNQIFGGMSWSGQEIVYVSPYEHNAVMRVLYQLQMQYGFEIEELGIDTATGMLDLERIAYQFMRKRPSMVVMSHVSNVTGYILPVDEVGKMAKTYAAVIVVDGAQALGLVPVNLKMSPIDFYIFAGHKTLYGPFGTGGFINCRGYRLKPVLAGGTGSDSLNLKMNMETVTGFEPGSPNIPAIAGLLAALQENNSERQKSRYEREQELTQYLLGQLSGIPEVLLYRVAEKAQQIGIVSFNIEGYQASEVGLILDEDFQIAVRTGYQCAPLIHKYLHSDAYAGVVRASIGRFTTTEEIDSLVQAVREIAEG